MPLYPLRPRRTAVATFSRLLSTRNSRLIYGGPPFTNTGLIWHLSRSGTACYFNSSPTSHSVVWTGSKRLLAGSSAHFMAQSDSAAKARRECRTQFHGEPHTRLLHCRQQNAHFQTLDSLLAPKISKRLFHTSRAAANSKSPGGHSHDSNTANTNDAVHRTQGAAKMEADLTQDGHGSHCQDQTGHSHSHEAESGHSHTDQSHESHSHETGHSHSHDDHSHSHSLLHSHSHGPNELLGKGFTTNPAVRITWIGLMVNVCMAASKAVGGVYFHSQALMADAIHSLSDMIADFLTLATVNVALKTGSPTRFPLGYGKIESVGTLLVSSVLLFAGVTVGWSSLLHILEFLLPTHIYEYLLALQVHSHSHSFGDIGADAGHSHSHSAVSGDAHHHVSETQVPNINAAWLALALIGVKELLYKKTMKVANETNSKVLVANAWHHRIDSLTAAVAFVTVTSGYLSGVVWLDAVGGALVSLLIINAGYGTLRDSWFELVDRGSPLKSEQYTTIKLIVDTELENVGKMTNTSFAVADLSVLTAGARTNLVVKLSTHENVTLDAMNKLEFELVSALKAKDHYIGRVLIQYELEKGEKLE